MAQIVYEVKTFEPEFTDIEITLRREIESILPEEMRGYRTETALNNLKNERATAPTFKPLDHFYAFAGEEFVGFIHLWPQEGQDHADISMAFVRPGHEEAAELLFRRVKEEAKERGIKQLKINTRIDNTLVMEFIKANSFEYQELDHLVANTPIDDIKVEDNDKFEFLDFNMDEHKDITLKLYTDLGYPKERIENQFEWIQRDYGDKIVSWKIAKKGDDVVGQSIAFLYDEEGKRIQMNAVTMGLEEESEKLPLINAMYKRHLDKAREKDMKKVNLNLFSNVLKYRPAYEGLGFEFQEINSYTFDL